MNTRTVGLSRLTAAACATAITAVSAWAFVSSTTSSERDPFRFASIMAANARVLAAQQQNRTLAMCRKSELPASPAASPDPVCLVG